MIECFMGCTPDEGEQFYVMAMIELTIYGHTIDRYIKESYPENWEATVAMRKDGLEYGCWHSDACADGEIGSNFANTLRPISFEEYVQASEQGWPYNADLTTLAPVAAVGAVSEDGRIAWEWSSLDATLGPRNQG